MASSSERGSEKVMAAWKARTLTEASVEETGAPPRIIINGIPFPDLVRMVGPRG